MRILISACLLGVRCRYDGASKVSAAAEAQSGRHELIPVCPEQLGGLSTPRLPCERLGDRVLRCDGEDCTAAYGRGAAEAVRLYELLGCDIALLKARSPMCGCGKIYDGTFAACLTDGNGVLTERLLRRGVRVLTEEEITQL